MICSMKIGSGEVNALLAGKDTKTHLALLARFTSGVVQRRNPFHPNVPAQFRTGAILEAVYFSTLPKNKSLFGFFHRSYFLFILVPFPARSEAHSGTM